MQVANLDDITIHYVETLRRWRENFTAASAELGERGYDERFQRIWQLYLAYCEAGFAERRILDLQLLLAKPAYRGSATVPFAPADSHSDWDDLPDVTVGAES